MNRTLHRIIFNARRGVRMAVSEAARSCGKACKGEARAALGALILLASAPLALAQIVADPSAPAPQKPTVLNAANGVPLVNIQTPSAAGVSRNTYKQFDVQPNGAILNNSRNNVQTTIGGWVQGNPWLAAGSARVILNEVNSSNPSLLKGWVEVAGQRAEVIIANPAGIQINGAGFLNASRVTLTTGTPVMNGGNLESYRVQGGAVTVSGAGLDLRDADYASVLARAVQVNAGIWAKNLKVVAGANTIDAASESVTAPAAPTGAAPAYMLDVAQLGGMYAGHIYLVGTEAGVGVNTQGTIQANAGQLVLLASGQLTNTGAISASGDLDVRSSAALVNTGSVSAGAHATVQSASTLTNSGTLQAGATLSVAGANVQNTASGQMTAQAAQISATDTLTNRGLIDAADTRINAGSLHNLGTGRIYGTRLGVAATSLVNEAETVAGVTTAATLAARERLDLGVGSLTNRDHALIFSEGDIAIAGALDAAGRADTTAAASVSNAGATIEAQGNISMRASQINNTNRDFSTQVVQVSSSAAQEYQIVGQAERWAPHQVGFRDEEELVLYVLHTGQASNWVGFNRYDFTRTVHETRVARSDPGQILAAGSITLDAGAVLNDKSRIVAGGALGGSIGTLNNTQAPGERVTTDAGSVTNFFRIYQRGRDTYGTSTTGYAPAPAVEALPVSPTQYTAGAAPAGSAASVPVSTAFNSSLLRLAPNPGSAYLVEADPRFANYRQWLSSDYLLTALSVDPATVQKRLGDGFYEQRLVREQVAQLTGRRFLQGYATDEEQYRSLMSAGATVAQQWDLRPGVSLSAAQMAQLTSDIVWLVEQEVSLPDGSKTRALVPQVYVRPKAGDLDGSGALLAGQRLQLQVQGDVVNSGALAGREVLQLNAENVHNLGGRIQAGQVSIAARTDLNNTGGSISADSALQVAAGRDLNVASTTRSQVNAQGARTNIDRVAGLYVTGASGTLVASAGRDVNIIAAAVSSAGDAYITAGNNLQLGTVQEAASHSTVWNANNRRQEATRQEVGSQISAQGNLTLRAGQDLSARAANVSAGGTLSASAGRDLQATAGQTTVQLDEAHQNTSKTRFRKQVNTSRHTLEQTTLQGSSFTGANVELAAGRNASIQASQVDAQGRLRVQAGGDLAITAGEESRQSTSSRSATKRGLLTSKASKEHEDESYTQAVGSSVRGNTVNINATGDATVSGSRISAQEDLRVSAGGDVHITSAQEHASQAYRAEQKKSGITASLSQISYGKSSATQNQQVQTITQVGSSLDGNNVNVQASRDANITASIIVAERDLKVEAGRNVSILAAANTHSSEAQSQASSTTIGLAPTGLSGNFTSFSKTSSSQAGQGTTTTQSTSLLAANSGNVAVTAGADMNQAGSGQGNVVSQGADILAKDAVSITGNAVNLQAIADKTSSASQAQRKSVTVGAQVLVNGVAVKGIADVAQDVRSTDNSRLQGAMALKGAYDAYKMASTAQSTVEAAQAAQPKGAGTGFGVSFSIGTSKSQQQESQSSSAARGTNIQASSIDITARETDITAAAAKLQAQDITLEARRDIHLEAAANTAQLQSSNSGSTAAIGATLSAGGSQNGLSFQLSASQSKGRANGSETTWDNTQVSATDTLTIKSGADTNLRGAQVAGDTVKVEVGGNLSVETLQDWSQYESKQTSGGFSISVCIPPICMGAPVTGSVSAAKQTIDHNYQSAKGQSGIAAGKGGFDITVQGNTDLKGAAITSQADKDKNSLTTGTLTSSDLSNNQNTSASSKSLNLAYGGGGAMATMAANVASNLLGNLGGQKGLPKSGSESSVTQSVVSPAEVTITSGDAASQATAQTLTSRDAATANQSLTNTLTLQQAQQIAQDQKRLAENQQAANMVGAVMTNVIGDIAQKNQWTEGSPQKLVLHGLAGAVQAKIAGGSVAAGIAGGVSQEALAPVMADYLESQGIRSHLADGTPNPEFNALMKAGATIAGAVAGAVVGGSTEGAATGGNVALTAIENNYLTHRQATEKKARLDAATTETEKRQIEEEYAALDAQQRKEAIACVLSSKCGSVLFKDAFRSVREELNAACAPPRLCTADEHKSLEELNTLYAKAQAIRPDTTIEEFLLLNKVATNVFGGARALFGRLMGETTTAVAKPLGAVNNFDGAVIHVMEAAPQYAFKADVNFMKTGANLEAAATRFVKDEAGKDFIAVFDSKVGSQGIDLAYAKYVNGKPKLVIGEAKAGDSALTALGENRAATLDRNLAAVRQSIDKIPDRSTREALLIQLENRTYQVELYTTTGNAAKTASRVDDVLTSRLGQPITRIVTFGKNQ